MLSSNPALALLLLRDAWDCGALVLADGAAVVRAALATGFSTGFEECLPVSSSFIGPAAFAALLVAARDFTTDSGDLANAHAAGLDFGAGVCRVVALP